MPPEVAGTGLSLTLYSSPVSDCAARLRLALHLKNLPFEKIDVLMSRGDNNTLAYRVISPTGTVPALAVYGTRSASSIHASRGPLIITQSLAALEFLEDEFREVPLLPPVTASRARAVAREIAAVFALDVHPLTTPRVAKALRDLPNAPQDDAAVHSWRVWWITRGLADVESRLQQWRIEEIGAIPKWYSSFESQYCVGHQPTLADVCLLPQLWTAERLGISLAEYPCVVHVYRNLSNLEAVKKAREDPAPEGWSEAAPST